MTYTIKIGKEINTHDVEEIFQAVGWGDLRTPEQWPRVLQQTTFVVQVLNGERTIGFARTVDDGDMCMIYDVCVHPDFQGKGIGSMLMHEVKAYIDSNDFVRVQLFAFNKTLKPQQFFKKFGFESVPNGMTLIRKRSNR